MSELEKKLWNFIKGHCIPVGVKYTTIDLAHDLAEIAEKDYEEKEEEYLEEITGRDGIIGKVIDERDELKKQLPITKEKIIKVLDKYRIKDSLFYGYINGDNSKLIASEILGDDNEK